MSVFHTALAALEAWLDRAAAGFDALLGAFRARRQVRLVEQDDGSFTLLRKGDRGKWTSLAAPIRIEEGIPLETLPATAKSTMQGATLEIVLQLKHFVVRPLELPAGAAAFLDGVLQAQIDRLTPWRPAEAAFGATSPESLGSDRIAIRVVATARSRLAAFLAPLRTLDAETLRVLADIGDGAQRAEVCVLSETSGIGRRIRRLRSLLTVGLVVAAFAASTTGVAWFTIGYSLDEQQDELEQAIGLRRTKLLAKDSAASADAIAALNARKQAKLPSVLALEALSQTLPDNTYLTDLHIEDGKLQIAGMTDDAPNLIRLIENSRQFSHAAFFEPTTHAPNESGQRFHVEALIQPKWMRTP